MSDNTLIEGMDGVNLDAKEEAAQQVAANTAGGFIINSYGGYSKKGYAPYNPKKKNQDALIMAEDPKTRSLFLCVLDGHGEDGDKVAQSIKGKFANYLFKHRSFADDIKTAIADVVAKVESEILRGGLLCRVGLCVTGLDFVNCQHSISHHVGSAHVVCTEFCSCLIALQPDLGVPHLALSYPTLRMHRPLN